MSRYIDLTLTLDEHIRGVSFSVARTIERDGWNARNLQLYSHAGTHMDAPIHFGIEGPTIDEFTIQDLHGRAWVVNLEPVLPRQQIELRHLGAVSEKIEPGDIVLFRTGWSRFVYEPKYRDELPGISMELAEWLVERKVKMIGVEPPSVADVNNREELTLVHQTLFRGNVIIVEGLTNLDAIGAEEVEFFALPLKIKDGDGCPCRAFAIEN
jgi:kynurenine formamidase